MVDTAFVRGSSKDAGQEIVDRIGRSVETTFVQGNRVAGGDQAISDDDRLGRIRYDAPLEASIMNFPDPIHKEHTHRET